MEPSKTAALRTASGPAPGRFMIIVGSRGGLDGGWSAGGARDDRCAGAGGQRHGATSHKVSRLTSDMDTGDRRTRLKAFVEPTRTIVNPNAARAVIQREPGWCLLIKANSPPEESGPRRPPKPYSTGTRDRLRAAGVGHKPCAVQCPLMHSCPIVVLRRNGPPCTIA